MTVDRRIGALKHADLSGSRFGRLTVLGRAPNKSTTKRNAYWFCRCDCGSPRSVRADLLKRGTTVSCGCFNKDNVRRIFTKHGLYLSPGYVAWVNMRKRCDDTTTRHYKNYGGRRIDVCEEWRGSFVAFFESVGSRPGPGYELDRINNDGNYEPGNCRWSGA